MNQSVELSKMTVSQLKDYMRLHKIKGITNPKATLIKLIIIYENHIKTSPYTIYEMEPQNIINWKDMFGKLKLRKNRKRDDYPLWSALYRAVRDESESLSNTDDKIKYMFETMYYFQTLPKKLVDKYDATYYKKFLFDLEDYFFGLSDTLQSETDAIEWNEWKQEQLNNKTDIDDEPREVVLPPITSWRDDLKKITEKQYVKDEVTDDNDVEYPVQSFTKFDYKMKPFKSPTTYTKRKLETQDPNPHMLYDETYEYEDFNKSGKEADEIPAQKINKHIPKYEPPENYKDQSEIYNQYKTYGEYGNSELVFSTVSDYLRDLNTIKTNAVYLDLLVFIKKMKAQISKPSSSVLFDYLHEFLVPIHRRQYEILLIYDENNDQLVHEDEVVTSSLEIIDEISDIIARTQYSLDQDRYKQFLQDVLSIIDGKPAANMLNIAKNFYIKYKIISSQKITTLIDENGIDTVDELISHMDEYIDEKKELLEDAEQKKRDKANQVRYNKEQKQRETDEKQREKQRDREADRYQKMVDDDERELLRENTKMQKMIDDLDRRIKS